ncbi:MAG: hypothetical protein KJZ57_03890, partial [Anaerolineales bacterium]|nr:hypothetical protein [Anaerolineales bacterium]
MKIDNQRPIGENLPQLPAALSGTRAHRCRKLDSESPGARVEDTLMPTKTHEHELNTALGEILQGMSSDWRVDAEQLGALLPGPGRPDILIERTGGWPLVVEAEVGKRRQAEDEAQSRLGKQPAMGSFPIETAVALVYPEALRNHSGASLRAALRETPLEYALFSLETDGSTHRTPRSGFLSGAVSDLALLLHRSIAPASKIEALADCLATGVNRAESILTSSHPIGSPLGRAIAAALGQSDDAAGQTRRMAMVVIANALVFQAALADAGVTVDDGPGSERPVRSPEALRQHGSLLPSQILAEWESVLAVNYWPLFHSAEAILRTIPTSAGTQILEVLWSTAEQLIAGGVTKSHDLTGVIFQRLIADRKFLATYYTRPPAAALLAGLALPLHRPFRFESWSDSTGLAGLRIADFACGTGTLISTAYQRIALLHQIHGGDPKHLHPVMMRTGLVGLDVLNVAVHLTAAMLASSHPDIAFDGECLLTMPYGKHEWGVSLGSLDLLSSQPSLESIQAAAHTAGGRGREEVRSFLGRLDHGQFDLVIMNPPFTRHGAREGERSEVHNPAFAAFEATEAEQDLLAKRLRSLAKGTAAHGHAGLASHFVELAHRKLSAKGLMAMVLPLSSMSGHSWEEIRALWRSNYSSIVVASIAERSTFSRSFSADTGMAECLFTARKEPPSDSPNRAVFAVLEGQPETMLEGELLAKAITDTIALGGVRKLEDGPFGGTRVGLGDSPAGKLLDCPLPEAGVWPVVGLSDLTLAQTAFQLAAGTLWIEGMPSSKVEYIPIAPIGAISKRMGPHHLDITGSGVKRDGLPQGPFERHSGAPSGAAYPCLWSHNNELERKLFVPPDGHLQLREVAGKVPETLRHRAEARWATATMAHYCLDLQFNSQSLVVATTERRSIGGRAWPSVVLKDPDHDLLFALWCNSTLGLLCHWWVANKTQAGRGCLTVSSIPLVPTLDVSKLSPRQHAADSTVFEALAQHRFLPFDQ